MEDPEKLFLESQEEESQESGSEIETKEKFRRFLKEQIQLPSTKWSPEFKKYIEKKWEETKKEYPERSPEEARELTFKRYLESLDLDLEKLKGKKILDLGCGEEGEFVVKAREKGLDVWGLDLKINKEKIPSQYRKYFIKGDYFLLPTREFDMILALGSVWPLVSEGSEFRRVLENCTQALKENGEIRIFPIGQVSPDSKLEGVKQTREKLEKVLKDLFSEGKIKYQFQPIDIGVSGKKPDIWLKELLIIEKK